MLFLFPIFYSCFPTTAANLGATEALWPRKAKIFTLWTITEKSFSFLKCQMETFFQLYMEFWHMNV